MLPILQLRIPELCRIETDLLRGGQKIIVGQTTCYHFDELTAAAASANENIDRFLTKAIVAGLAGKPVKSRLLFWYAPGNEHLFLSFTDKRLQVYFPWMHEIPGYFEQGREPLHDNAAPILYYDGKNTHRIYELPKDFEDEKLYLSDFCGLGGIYLGETDEEMYEYVNANPVEKYDYSIVPRESEEILTVKGKKHVLLHAFWQPV